MRRQCSKLLNLKRFVSLPFAGSMVLLPVKTRQAVQAGETTLGYLNLLQVVEIVPLAPAANRQAGLTGPFQPGAGTQGTAVVRGGTADFGSDGAALPPAAARAADRRSIYSTKKGAPRVSWKTETDVPAVSPGAGAAEPVWLSLVKFECGLQIKTLNTPETLHDRLRQGKAVLEDYRKRQKRGTVITGFSSQKLLGELPACNCFLKDIFKNFLNLRNSKN